MTVPLAGYAVEANELWRHSLTAAAAAEFIVSNGIDMNVDAPVAFTVGLLHDIGKLVLSQVLTPEYQADIRMFVVEKGFSRSEAEKAVLGTDHAEVGGALLQAWHLPEEISEAVANHHRPVLAPKPKLSAVAHLANCIAYRVNAAPGVESAEGRVEERVMEAFGLSDERLENIVTGVRESCEHVDQLMSLA